MVILRIEHHVQDYDGWKKLFDSDPIGRKKLGVQHYRIFRPTNDPKYVIIDLEFLNLDNAEAALTALRNLWGQVEGKAIFNPQARVIDLVEYNKV